MNDSLHEFFARVESSCNEHALRKGYKSENGDTLGIVTKALGVSQHHAIGEICAKMVEYQRAPRRVLAEKIAGWAWRLWVNTPE